MMSLSESIHQEYEILIPSLPEGFECFSKPFSIKDFRKRGLVDAVRKKGDKITIVAISTFIMLDYGITSYAVEYTLEGKRVDDSLYHGLKKIESLFQDPNNVFFLKNCPSSFPKEK